MGVFDVNYEDERFSDVEKNRQAALTENEQLYSGMIGESDKYYQEQKDALSAWGEKQQQLQQDRTDFSVEQIEQQKQKAAKDYKKEQSGAYADWRKQSNEYGAEAEKMASSGLDRTGYSESSQVSMYNTYQSRLASARESYNQAVLSYDNAIKDARLQNNAALAEIAFQTLQQQLELSLQGFQYKNSLISEQANRKTELDNIHYGRYQDVLNQINNENAQKESVRQFELELKRLKENDAYSKEIEKAKLGAEMGDFSLLKKLGIDVSQAGTSSSEASGKTLPTGYIDELEVLADPESHIGKTNEDILVALLKKADYLISAGYDAKQINSLVENLIERYGLEEAEEEEKIPVPRISGSTYKSGGGGGLARRVALATDSKWI